MLIPNSALHRGAALPQQDSMLFSDRAAGKAFAFSALVTVALAAFHDASTQHELASPAGSAGIWTELASARMARAAIAAEVLAIAMLAAGLSVFKLH